MKIFLKKHLPQFPAIQKWTKNQTQKLSHFIFKISMAATTLPAMAALPTIAPPTGGGIGGATVQDGDFLGMMGGYFKLGLTILGLVIAALAFISVVTGGLRRWKDYSEGRQSLGELKEYLVASVIIAAFVVLMIGYAMSTLA